MKIRKFITIREFITNKDAGVISHGIVHAVVTLAVCIFYGPTIL